MKKFIIDTDVLISFVTDRNLAQQEEVARLFEAVSRLKCTLICPQSVLTEFVFVIDKVYQRPKKSINAMIRDFIDMPGVELRHEVDFDILPDLWPQVIDDYGDALVPATGKAAKGAMIVTFDAKFKAGLKQLGLPVYEGGMALIE